MKRLRNWSGCRGTDLVRGNIGGEREQGADCEVHVHGNLGGLTLQTERGGGQSFANFKA